MHPGAAGQLPGHADEEFAPVDGRGPDGALPDAAQFRDERLQRVVLAHDPLPRGPGLLGVLPVLGPDGVVEVVVEDSRAELGHRREDAALVVRVEVGVVQRAHECGAALGREVPGYADCGQGPGRQPHQVGSDGRVPGQHIEERVDLLDDLRVLRNEGGVVQGAVHQCSC